MRHIIRELFRDEYKITTVKHAHRILSEIQRRRERISLRMNGSDAEYESIILDIDDKAGTMVIDAPSPRTSPSESWTQGKLICIVHHNGIYVGFELNKAEAISWHADAALKVRKPSPVYFLQRRQSFRVVVAPGDVKDLYIVRDGEAAVRAECHDLSVGGMRALVQIGRDAIPFFCNESVPEVHFRLRGDPITVSATITHVGSPIQGKTGRGLIPLGIEFRDKPPLFEQRVGRYVQERDRALLAEH